MREWLIKARSRRPATGWSTAILLATTTLAGAVHAATPVIPPKTCSITHYGAEGSRIWSQLVHTDTTAFQRAIDDCAKSAGGTVLVPSGEWLIGPIRLANGIRLHLAKGAEIAGTGEPEPYAPGLDGGNRGLIEIENAHDVVIDGEGLIDGQGAVWWERMRALWRSDPNFATDGKARQAFHDTRPRLILVTHSRNVVIRGVTIANSPSYHIVLDTSEDVTVEDTTITAPAHAPNTDGIDPVNSRRVLIRHNRISVGDDMVAIKSDRPDPAHPDAASEDIAVIGNILGRGRGICIGSDTRGGVRHVRIEGNHFGGSLYGLRIKTARGRGGRIGNVMFRDNSMTGVESPIVLSSYYGYRPMDRRAAEAALSPGGFILGNQSWPGPDDPAQPIVGDRTPIWSHIFIDQLVATDARSAGIVVGLPEGPIAVRMRHVRITAPQGLLIRNATVKADQSHLPPSRIERGGHLVP